MRIFIEIAAILVLLGFGWRMRSDNRLLDAESANLRRWIEHNYWLRLGAPQASYSEMKLLESACKTIVTAYESGHTNGLEKYYGTVKRLELGVTIDNTEEVWNGLYRELHDSFLWTRYLLDFDTETDFAYFLKVNYDLSMYHGERLADRQSFELLTKVEELILDTLLRYRDKFKRAGKDDCAKVAEQYLQLLERHIESGDGFTRKGVRNIVWLNTEYVRAVRPGFEISKFSSVRLARSYVLGLIKTGYTPKWLDVEYPLK